MALCAVTGTLQDASGAPLVGITVSFYGAVPTVVGSVVIADKLVSAPITDSNGIFTVNLTQGTKVRLRCNAIGCEAKPLVVPSTPTATLAAMLTAAGVT